MPFTTGTETELPELATAGAETSPEPDDIEYPEGRWTAPSVWHGDAVAQAATALVYHFRERTAVLVAMELRVYYERGNNKVWLWPDVQVVFGVSREDRPSYLIWEEGKAPDFVLEVASPPTADGDAEHKAREYAKIGVREYWRLDPQGTLMGASLEGYEATGEKYDQVQPVASRARGRRFRSKVLGLDLWSRRQADGPTVLVFRDPRTGEEFDGTLEGSDRRRWTWERDSRVARQEAIAAEREATALEQKARAAEQKARAAEERVRELEEQLRALTAYSDPPERDR